VNQAASGEPEHFGCPAGRGFLSKELDCTRTNIEQTDHPRPNGIRRRIRQTSFGSKEKTTMKRRDFIGTNMLALAGGALAAHAANAAETPHKNATIQSQLSPDVQMQFMRPAQLEAAGRKFPVVYVPFGLIEWHGVHLPLGNDAIKAHGILVKCAEKFGGAVYPPVYFHNGFRQEHLVPVLTDLFNRLKRTGYRVIIGVSGHNVRGQRGSDYGRSRSVEDPIRPRTMRPSGKRRT
jgi:hypothetical protein